MVPSLHWVACESLQLQARPWSNSLITLTLSVTQIHQRKLEFPAEDPPQQTLKKRRTKSGTGQLHSAEVNEDEGMEGIECSAPKSSSSQITTFSTGSSSSRENRPPEPPQSPSSCPDTPESHTRMRHEADVDENVTKSPTGACESGNTTPASHDNYRLHSMTAKPSYDKEQPHPSISDDIRDKDLDSSTDLDGASVLISFSSSINS